MWHLIPPLVYPGVCVCHALICVVIHWFPYEQWRFYRMKLIKNDVIIQKLNMYSLSHIPVRLINPSQHSTVPALLWKRNLGYEEKFWHTYFYSNECANSFFSCVYRVFPSCNNVALPYFYIRVFTGEGYNSVVSLLWRKKILMHYLVFPMIFTLCYP